MKELPVEHRRNNLYHCTVHSGVCLSNTPTNVHIYGPRYENGEWKSRTNREIEEMRKYSKVDKRAKDKLVRSPRENGGG
jgi:hypothetical protein